MQSKQTKDSKISLFTKSYTIKACSLFVLIYMLIGGSTQVQAFSFPFGDLFKSSEVEKVSAETNNFGTDDASNNLQKIDIVSSFSTNPDVKNSNDCPDLDMDDGALSTSTCDMGSGLENNSNGEMRVYEVRSGDTLSEIAMEFDVSMNTIKWENNLTSSTLKVGQKLNILPVTGVKHIVKSGDSLDKIAIKYEANVTDIMVFNGVSKTEGLKVGRILYVPNGIKPAIIVYKPSQKPGSNYVYTPSTTVASGYYIRPANGPTTSSYGSRRGGFHYGIDIGVSRGSTVLAAATGTVVETVGYCVEGRSSCGGRYGNYIMIQHPNGTITRYAHLSKVRVSVGDTVSKGDPIAKSGNTGRSTGPHVHFQIEKANGSTISPVFNN